MRDRFERELERLSAMDWAAVVVEATLETIVRDPPPYSELSPKTVYRSLLAWSVRYPVRWVTAGPRELVEGASVVAWAYQVHPDGRRFEAQLLEEAIRTGAGGQGLLGTCRGAMSGRPWRCRRRRGHVACLEFIAHSAPAAAELIRWRLRAKRPWQMLGAASRRASAAARNARMPVFPLARIRELRMAGSAS